MCAYVHIQSRTLYTKAKSNYPNVYVIYGWPLCQLAIVSPVQEIVYLVDCCFQIPCSQTSCKIVDSHSLNDYIFCATRRLV